MNYGLTEHKEVALLRDVPNSPLRAGDVAVLVDIVPLVHWQPPDVG